MRVVSSDNVAKEASSFVSGDLEYDKRLLVDGRCKLLGVTISIFSGTTGPGRRFASVSASYDAAVNVFDLRNGGSSGDLLFRFNPPVGFTNSWGPLIPVSFMFGSSYILFDSGIYLDTEWGLDDELRRAKGSYSRFNIYYEGGGPE